MPSRWPPRPRRLAGAALLAFSLALLVGGLGAGAATGATGGRGGGSSEQASVSEGAGRASRPASERDQEAGIEVAQVDGLLDPPNASLVRDTIRAANTGHATLLVVQVSSGGGLDTDVAPLVRAIRRSRVPIAVWVGPSGAKAEGAAAELALAAPVVSVANGASIGPAHPVALDRPGASSARSVASRLDALARANDRPTAGARALVTRRLSAERARALGAVDSATPTLGELIVSLDGRTVTTAAGPVRLSTARVVGKGTARRREPNQTVRFRKLGLASQAVHTLTSPAVAYLLLVAGLALIVFEFFMASIGLASAAGALAVVGAFVGFSHLPAHWWAIGLLMLGVLGFSIDAQAGGLGAWTLIGTAALVAGSCALYGGSSRLDVAWWVIVAVCAGTVLFMVAGMTAAIRARFSTPTIGREGMVGEPGTAEVDVAPDGVVRVRDALWRARTNRATPVRAGDPVRVVEVAGLVLEVEPEEGGARDYRDGYRRARPEG